MGANVEMPAEVANIPAPDCNFSEEFFSEDKPKEAIVGPFVKGAVYSQDAPQLDS